MLTWVFEVPQYRRVGREGQQAKAGVSIYTLALTPQIVGVGLEVDQQACPSSQSQAVPQYVHVPDF